MLPTPFHAYYEARKLEIYNDNALLPAFASSNIEVYPYQIAAAGFVMCSFMRGCLLSDESSLGKTYEALLVATQKWLLGKTRQMLILPVNMIDQWTKKIESSFTIPYILIDSTENWNAAEIENPENPFVQESLVITTYDFAVQKSEYIQSQAWDLIIFDEADCLNQVYEEDKKIARTLKVASENAFKLLLTASPIEMDIRDIYGLIYFIDETVLPTNVDEFYQYYFRRPDRYPELAAWVSKFCFRTLKNQVTNYANFTNRIPYTLGCDMTKEEQALYDRLHTYFMRPVKFAYPASKPHDLMMNHCPKISSSPQQITDMFVGVLDRLQRIEVEEKHKNLLKGEISAVAEIVDIGKKLKDNGKMRALLPIIKQCLSHMKRLKSPEKAIVFVNYRLTQKTLYSLLTEKGYNVLTYSGANSRDYAIMERFRTDKTVQILIATDEAAKGLDIEFCPVVVNYDMLTNAAKLDQRISRCHRQGQNSDVLVINMLSRDNYADVRCLQLINKRFLQFDGIFGMSDTILGNFDMVINDVLSDMRHANHIQVDFAANLAEHEDSNRPIIENAEDMLFTTFTKEIADKVQVTPQYIAEQSDKMNAALWEVVAGFLSKEGYIIDEAAQTATLPPDQEPKVLFYYHTGSRNKPYKGHRSYGMSKDFKPHTGRITFASPIGRGILFNIDVANEGEMTVDGDIEPCKIGLFSVEVADSMQNWTMYNAFIGQTDTGQMLTHEDCEKIMQMLALDYSDGEHKSARWLKGSTSIRDRACNLEMSINREEFIQKRLSEQTGEQADAIEAMKLKVSQQKAALERTIDDLRLRIKTLEQEAAGANKMAQLNAQKQLAVIYNDYMEKEERLFLDCNKLDAELESRIEEFTSGAKLKCSVRRQFTISVTGTQN